MKHHHYGHEEVSQGLVHYDQSLPTIIVNIGVVEKSHKKTNYQTSDDKPDPDSMR